jgi:hypothetical protein
MGLHGETLRDRSPAEEGDCEEDEMLESREPERVANEKLSSNMM